MDEYLKSQYRAVIVNTAIGFLFFIVEEVGIGLLGFRPAVLDFLKTSGWIGVAITWVWFAGDLALALPLTYKLGFKLSKKEIPSKKAVDEPRLNAEDASR